ncbi:ABC transporter ATP-binding protein [uncultured Methanolobus sp.]|uniref:ABC transporter ATP-binding protein n=1 Tax=uncultured Methanolobus sp. TaxID=218300 RepID=UPI00374989CF
MNTLSRLQTYMGGRKILLPAAVILSGISSLTGILPFIFIWLIVRELLLSTMGSQALINTYAWWAMGTAVGGVVLYFLALMLSHLAAFRVETNMRRQAMQKIVRFPLGFFDGNTSGRIRKIIDDNASITHTFLAHQLPDLAGTILVPLASLVLVFVFDWRLGLACLVPIIAAMAVMGYMMGTQGRFFMEMYMTSLEEMNTEAVEYVRGIPVVKVFQQTIFSFKNFHNSIIKYRDMVYKYTLMWEKPMTTYTVIIHGFVYILIPVAILLIGNSASYAEILLDLFFYILITPVFAQSVMKSMYLNQALGQATEAVNRIDELTDVELLPMASNPKAITNHEISFRDVSFSYPGSEQKAIDDISFTIPEGKTFALVGASGSGKTTIARLVPRFWDVDTGQITIGGNNVKDIAPMDLMQHVSFVFQNTRLFKTSLLENIRYGNDRARPEAIENAVKSAQCREIIDKLPDGLDTKIGAEGTYLSGGEQQRIALARAILKDAPIVVLDEATAFADPENEHLIQKALGKLTTGKTVLMIAHRLTSVMDVDSILVVNKGKIAEQGTHSELMDKQGIYAGMWKEYQKSVQWTIGKEAQI